MQDLTGLFFTAVTGGPFVLYFNTIAWASRGNTVQAR